MAFGKGAISSLCRKCSKMNAELAAEGCTSECEVVRIDMGRHAWPKLPDLVRMPRDNYL